MNRKLILAPVMKHKMAIVIAIFLFSPFMFHAYGREDKFSMRLETFLMRDTKYKKLTHGYNINLVDPYTLSFIGCKYSLMFRNPWSNGEIKIYKDGVFKMFSFGGKFSYSIGNATFADSYNPINQAMLQSVGFRGSFFELGIFTGVEIYDKVFVEMSYGLRFNFYSAEDSANIPLNNKQHIVNMGIKSHFEINDKLIWLNQILFTYSQSNRSKEYGLKYIQFKKILLSKWRSYVEYNAHPFFFLLGVTGIYSVYGIERIGHPITWLDKHEEIIYGVPEKEIPLYSALINRIGFRYIEIFNSPISVRFFNSILWYSDKEKHMPFKLINGLGGGIDIKINFDSMGLKFLRFLNNETFIGYIVSYNIASKISYYNHQWVVRIHYNL